MCLSRVFHMLNAYNFGTRQVKFLQDTLNALIECMLQYIRQAEKEFELVIYI